MDDGSLYFKHPELMTPEEIEDGDFVPNSCPVPDMPPEFKIIMSAMGDRANPEAMERAEFECRPPALGMTMEALDAMSAHEKNTEYLPVQRRCIFRRLRGAMLRQLIPCSGCSTIDDLCNVLKAEIESGIPAPVPKWYTYSTVTMGPRRIGYYHCSTRGCFQTETVERKFSVCSGCSLPFYCSKACQKKDWKERHKKVCKEGKEEREKVKKVGKMFQMLSDMSLTGQMEGASLEEMLANASTNPAVKQRRKELRAEKKRPK